MNMFRPLVWLNCSAVTLCLALPITVTATPITIDTVLVGNPGNSPDQEYFANGQFGAVAYNYRIGTYEVTNGQYTAFLNEKAKSDPLGLYDPWMGITARGGITRSGLDGAFTYATKPDMTDKPVNWVSWYDAIRFANWLHNGQGVGDTESGAYTILGGTPTPSNALSITRNPGATWFLTSEDEWYKAAYHHPTSQGGDADDYWLYPTRSNSAPALAAADTVGNISNPGANIANYGFGTDWNGQDGNVTSVGSAGPLSYSFYGTADQGGNAYEWIEAMIDSSGALRGGGWHSIFTALQASIRSGGNPTGGADFVGFRVATIEAVPEPSSIALASMGLFGVLLWAVRRKIALR